MDVVFNHTLGSGPENPKSVSVNHGPGRMAIYSLLIFTWLVNSEKPKVFQGRIICTYDQKVNGRRKVVNEAAKQLTWVFFSHLEQYRRENMERDDSTKMQDGQEQWLCRHQYDWYMLEQLTHILLTLCQSWSIDFPTPLMEQWCTCKIPTWCNSFVAPHRKLLIQ